MDRDLRKPENAALRRLIMAGNLMAVRLEELGELRPCAIWDNCLEELRSQMTTASQHPCIRQLVEGRSDPLCTGACEESDDGLCERCREIEFGDEGLGDEADVRHVLEDRHG